MIDHGKRAQLLYESRLYEQAEKELYCAIADQPADADANSLLCFTLSELNREDEAIAIGKKAVELAPDYSRSYHALAFSFYRAQRYAEADFAIGEAIKLEPEYARLHKLASNIAYSQHCFAEALELADKACALDPTDAPSLSAKASALLALGRLDEADAVLKSGLKLNPEESAFFISKGRQALLQNDHERSIEFCQEALRLEPDSESSHYAMACALDNAGRHEEAEGYIRECIRMNPKDGINYSMLSQILYSLERPVEALEAAREGVRLSPDVYIPHSGLAEILVKTKNAEAESQLKEDLARWPDRMALHRLMVEVLCGGGRYKEAVAQSAECLKQLPQRPDAHCLHVYALVKSGNWKQAELKVKEALELFPASINVYEQATALAFECKRRPEVLKYAEKCRELQPNDSGFLQWHATALMALNRMDEADRILDEGLSLKKDLDLTHVNKGLIAMNRGEIESSISHLNKALEINPSSQIARTNLSAAIKNRNPLYRFFWKQAKAPGSPGMKFYDLMYLKPATRVGQIAHLLSMPIFLCGLVFTAIVFVPVSLFGSGIMMLDPVGKKLLTKKDLVLPLIVSAGIAVLVGAVSLLVIFHGIIFQIIFSIIFWGWVLLTFAYLVNTRKVRPSLLLLIFLFLLIAGLNFWNQHRHHGP
jgi:tetratricopeptide (TPR) repeat protein